MAIDQELIAAIARELHGRSGIEPPVLEETAARLSAFLAKLRQADERSLQAVAPAFSFHPGQAAYQTPPLSGPHIWEGIAAAGGGTGYGGSGTTGSAAPGAVDPPPDVPAGPDFLFWPATELALALRRGDLSPTEVVRATLDRIAAVDPAVNAFVAVRFDEALAEAKRLEASRPRGLLWGVPVAIKDVIDVKGVPTTAGSRLMAGGAAAQDAAVTARLRAAGAVLVGKTATHEFAFGTTTDSPYHGPVRNPFDLRRIPGGSSGGSAAALAVGMVAAAIGTDTGGSIRIPAACCGVVGLKPTYGRVSKAGVVPLSWSLDHVGPIVRSVADAALLLQAIAGADPADPSAAAVPVDDYVAAARPSDLRAVRLGVPRGWLDGPLDPEVQGCFESALQRIRELGAAVVEVELPPAEVMAFVNRLLALAEAGAYHTPLLREEAERYAPDVRLRLELGQFLSARDYLVGQRLRAELTRQLHQTMARVDALAVPTLPIPPALIGQGMWEYGDGRREPVAEATIRWTAPFNVTGQPAISLPCGYTAAGLPVGLQLVGRAFGEAALLRIAARVEAALGPVRRPPF